MIQSNNDAVASKKTLGLSTGKLGLSVLRDVQPIVKNCVGVYNTESKVNYQGAGNKPRVLVVTKGRAASSATTNKLTKEEQEQKLQLLRSAELSKRKEKSSTIDEGRGQQVLEGEPYEESEVDNPFTEAASTVDSTQSEIKAEECTIILQDEVVSICSKEQQESGVSTIQSSTEKEPHTKKYGNSIKQGEKSIPVQPLPLSQLKLASPNKMRNLDDIVIRKTESRPGVVMAPLAAYTPVKPAMHSTSATATVSSSVKNFSKKKIAKVMALDEPSQDNTTKKTSRGDTEKEYKRANKYKGEYFALDDEGIVRTRSMASIKRAKEKVYKRQRSDSLSIQEKVVREVLIPDTISVQELANRMAEKASDLIKTLMKLGVMVTVNQSIDAEIAEIIVVEFGHKPKHVTDTAFEQKLIYEDEDSLDSLESRAPVVTVMGHVDHGKTSLLDALRSTDIAVHESGGITQHIGASKVELANGRSITFLDTPGHEAFTAMRMRGAKVTDIVVLVVAADDGIKEQTIEAINHAKAAGVPIIVAINKIDKPNANPSLVKNALLSHGLVPEDMRGDVITVEVSAKNGLGLANLEEAILLQADLLELKANPHRMARGAVIESRVDRGRGVLATLLVQRGTLKVGDIVVVGSCYGKVRALYNDKGEAISAARPSMPAEVLGLDQVPVSGDEFMVVADEKNAKGLVALRMHREREKRFITSRRIPLDHLFIKRGTAQQELAIIVKADVHGSVEAIVNSLSKIKTDEVSVKVLHSGVGAISESDIALAVTSGAVIVGFNVRANSQAKSMANHANVIIRYYSIIYNLIDEIKAVMSGMLSPVTKENFLGYAEIREVFDISKFGKVAGCYITEGMAQRGAYARLLRNDVVIYEGRLKALKRFKEDVREVKASFECGISFEKYDDFKVGDKVELFTLVEETRKIT